MDQLKHRDPASRLHAIVKLAYECGPEYPMLRAWWEALRIPGTADLSRLVPHLRELRLLVEEAERAVLATAPSNPGLYREPFPAVRKAIQESLDRHLVGKWQEARLHLNPVVVRGLEFCAERVAERDGEATQPDGLELDGIRDDIENLLERVLGSELDEPLRSFLAQQLETLRHSLVSYRILGRAALVQGLATVALEVHLHESFYQEHRDAPEVRDFEAICSKYKTVIDLVLKTTALGYLVKGFLT